MKNICKLWLEERTPGHLKREKILLKMNQVQAQEKTQEMNNWLLQKGINAVETI
jgi:hypothetical protein